jgi:hypothetical protein
MCGTGTASQVQDVTTLIAPAPHSLLLTRDSLPEDKREEEEEEEEEERRQQNSVYCRE